jgi:hypothetical protein
MSRMGRYVFSLQENNMDFEIIYDKTRPKRPQPLPDVGPALDTMEIGGTFNTHIPIAEKNRQIALRRKITRWCNKDDERRSKVFSMLQDEETQTMWVWRDS